MKKLKIAIPVLITTIIFSGCSTPAQYINMNKSNSKPMTMGIDRQDFEKAASDMVESLLTSNVLDKKDGSRYVIMMSDILNDTTQNIDTRMLTKKIRIALRKSGKAIMTNAVGTEQDSTTINSSRAIRGNKEFNQKSASAENALIGAELGLAGRILQRAAETNDGDQLVEYYFQMELTNAHNGLVYWEDEAVVGKLGSNDTVIW